jgi:peptidylprolyl isomerase
MRILRPIALLSVLIAGVASAADAPAPAVPPPEAWRDVAPDNLVLIDTRYGQVVVELAPEFAPGHVERMRKLLHAHFFDGKTFYRVIDGFVAQGGANEDTSATPNSPVNDQLLKDWPKLKAEFDHPLFDDPKFTPLGNPDLFAPEVGFVDGFPAGRDMTDKREWVLHCPGTFAFARDNDDNTATTEFYIVIGEAPRRLDRNLTAFGRVLSGMQYLQKLQRGDPDVDSGVIHDPAKPDPIIRMQLASDMPAKDRPHWQVLRTESASFADAVEKRRHPAPEFYHRPPLANLDVCAVPVQVRLVK